MRRDPVHGIKCPEPPQQRPRFGQRRGGRRRQKRQIGAAPDRQFQRQPGQVGLRHVRRGEGGQRPLLAPGPQLVTHPRRHPAGAARPLRRLGPRHPVRHQPRHACAGVEPRPPRQPGIDDHPDIGNRQRGFGNRRRQHHLAPGVHRRNRRPLRGKGQGPVQRPDGAILGQGPGQKCRDPADLGLARQKHQHPARVVSHRLPHLGRHRLLQPLAGQAGAGLPVQVHRKAAALGGDDRGTVQQRRHRRGVQRRRHHQQDQVGAQCRPRLPDQSKAQIGVQRPFVKLVKDHCGNPGQTRVGLHHPGQDALGHHLDPRCGTDRRLAPHPVADRRPYRLAQSLRHPLGGGPHRQPARLQHDDPAGTKTRLQHRQRHAGGLARPRRGLQHRPALLAQGIQQGGQGGVDGQRVGHATGLLSKAGTKASAQVAGLGVTWVLTHALADRKSL